MNESDDLWCQSAAVGLGLVDPAVMRDVLAFADGCRGLAWRFAFGMAARGFCPGSVARQVLELARPLGQRASVVLEGVLQVNQQGGLRP